ncbi:hypothetical protein AruPA_16070 [Acidiphilium sp. PA]|uniref:hypothetical protein n=1 Tax=Acidiphilium sp. PA TaxID=2871705 RepID=UPI002244227B|nr:hypothetical protein [Acidiphilium sp. PA]MCW8308555.1 hypothetical protein [Acidiphilium sp. PA]
MHSLIVLVLHAIVYGVVFHLLRHLTEPDLVGLGVACLAGLLLSGRTPIMRRRYRGQRW